MSALLPPEAICLVYRRYLKATNKIPNVTIRMLLLQQIRFGFRRHQSLSSTAAQRELVKQAHKDLQVLEDDRLSRTLYINKLGLVSCLDWEIRRTEYNVSPKAKSIILVYLAIGFSLFLFIALNVRTADDAHPEISKMVGAMAMRLEGDTPEEVMAERQRVIMSGIERKQNRLSLESRILSTFNEAPFAQQPSLRNPDGMHRQ